MLRAVAGLRVAFDVGGGIAYEGGMGMWIWLIASVLVAGPVVAEAPRSLLDELPAGALRDGENQFLTLNIENDNFGGDSDRHYTSGVRLNYFDLRAQPPLWAERVAELVPMFAGGERLGGGYGGGHNLYTPDDIGVAAPQAGQRPWAALLYGSVGLVGVQGRHVDELELTAGVVGPWAMGEFVQKTIHSAMDVRQPQGWDNQLHNEPVLGLAWQRRWPNLYRWSNDAWNFAVEPSAGVTLGNAYTYGAGGLAVKFGPLNARFQDSPVRVAPAMPGTGFYARPTDDAWASWFVFASANGRVMARNIFLDGNTFDGETPRVDRRWLVGDLNAGVAVSLGRARVSYALVSRSREYFGQPEGDVFGVLNFGYRF